MLGKKKHFTLPYEPDYTAHWEEERRRRETKAWLRQRERAGEPSLTPPDHQCHTEGEAASNPTPFIRRPLSCY
jgi:hypothetical protein